MTSEERTAYYQAALIGLSFAESRRATERRFGPDADARWANFQGQLTTADRIDLLLRDADVEWPGAFGARTVFELPATREDDPFGPAWHSLDPVAADAMWRSLAPDTHSASTALEAVFRAWGLPAQGSDVKLPELSASDRLLIVGPSAAAAVIAAFIDNLALDLERQTVFVATSPAHRHIAALGSLLVNINKPMCIVSAGDTASDIAKGSGYRLVESADAHPDDAALARRLLES